MTDRPGKAAIVEKPRTERVAEALEAEGVYDPGRRIEAYDADRVALPVTDPPTETDVEAVVDLDLPARERGLADVLRSRGVPERVVEAAPRLLRGAFVALRKATPLCFEGLPLASHGGGAPQL